MMDSIDDPAVIAEVTRLFHAYEAALMGNDVAAINGFFWADPRTTRYGVADRQLGIDQLVAYRAAILAPDFTRRLENLRIATFGVDTAIAQVEFIRSDTPLRGFQTQTWIRMAEGWRIVAAHVSMIAFEV